MVSCLLLSSVLENLEENLNNNFNINVCMSICSSVCLFVSVCVSKITYISCSCVTKCYNATNKWCLVYDKSENMHFGSPSDPSDPRGKVQQSHVQPWPLAIKRLLNNPYVNGVNLTKQKPLLKYRQHLETWHTLKRGLDL